MYPRLPQLATPNQEKWCNMRYDRKFVALAKDFSDILIAVGGGNRFQIMWFFGQVTLDSLGNPENQIAISYGNPDEVLEVHGNKVASIAVEFASLLRPLGDKDRQQLEISFAEALFEVLNLYDAPPKPCIVLSSQKPEELGEPLNADSFGNKSEMKSVQGCADNTKRRQSDNR